MVVVVEATERTSWLELARAAARRPLTRGVVADLARRLRAHDDPAGVDAAVDEAVARGEGAAAAALTLAQADVGRRPDAGRLAPILPLLVDDLVLEALVAAATGDRVGLLVDAVRWLEPNSAAFALLLATTLLEGAAPPAGLLRELRLLAREKLLEESGDMLATVAQALKDADALAVVQPWIDAMKEAGAGAFDLVVQRRRLHGPPLAILPEADEPAAVAAEDGAPLQAEAKVGRNDPCPCGSGKKYKKCHGA